MMNPRLRVGKEAHARHALSSRCRYPGSQDPRQDSYAPGFVRRRGSIDADRRLAGECQDPVTLDAGLLSGGVTVGVCAFVRDDQPVAHGDDAIAATGDVWFVGHHQDGLAVIAKLVEQAQDDVAGG